jgi:hypothetical protein
LRKQYRILSFIILLKKLRENSCIYHIENQIKLAAKMGISYKAFKKYYHLAKQEGCLVEQGENVQAINFVACIHTLGLTEKITRFTDVFNNYEYEKINFQVVYDRVIEAVLHNNFGQQQYNIDCNKYIVAAPFFNDRTKMQKQSKLLKQLSKKAAKEGKSTDELIEYIKKEGKQQIVTGKHHSGRVLGFSPQSALNRLRKLHKEGSIIRTVHSDFISQKDMIVDGVLYQEYIEQINTLKMFPVNGGFYQCLGSVISLPNYQEKKISDYPLNKTRKYRKGKKSI